RLHAAAPQVTSPDPRRAAPMPAQAGGAGGERAALAGAQRELAARVASEPTEGEQDAARLAMSTLSFQDYVRERMLKRRHAELHAAPIEDDGEAQRTLAAAAHARAASTPRPALRALPQEPEGYADDRGLNDPAARR